MTRYEQTLQKAADEGLTVEEAMEFNSSASGLIVENVIALNRTLTSGSEKSCILAEELGHYYTSAGNILDLSDPGNRKQEHRARMWAYNEMIGLAGIVSCFRAGCHSRYEMAAHLGVTETFLQECLDAYRQKYGTYTRLDNYVILFEPSLAVYELCE